ncbi:MAG: hypothetical protein DMD79_16885 [Candidatus Rokuibacteriota bacterium]|nr:MAG: hypothetical protein DMD79_16885 [Candidatus Rokubacteria bacterium]
MRAYVAVTDREWFRFLRLRPDLDEVSFWQPGGTREFRALSVGQPFLFKLHYPNHAIVGGGYLRHASALVPTSLAWEAFGEKNGVDSLAEMRRRIEGYRRIPTDSHADYVSKVACSRSGGEEGSLSFYLEGKRGRPGEEGEGPAAAAGGAVP